MTDHIEVVREAAESLRWAKLSGKKADALVDSINEAVASLEAELAQVRKRLKLSDELAIYHQQGAARVQEELRIERKAHKGTAAAYKREMQAASEVREERDAAAEVAFWKDERDAYQAELAQVREERDALVAELKRDHPKDVRTGSECSACRLLWEKYGGAALTGETEP